MLETSARLLELLSLLQARRDWSGAELAERLEVGPRTVRRDVERLRMLGYPVQATRGVAGGYRLGSGGTLPPLLLDEEEAVAVAVGLRAAASAGVSGIEETSVGALAKLEQMLPARLRRRVGALGWAMVPCPGRGPVVDPDVLATIAGACRERERLRFGYRAYDGSEAKRLVEPHRLVHTGRRWYLVAWDARREDWRTFRVDRVSPPLSRDRRFAEREAPAKDIVAYVERGVSAARDRYQARVLLLAPLEQVRPRVPPWAGTLEPAGENACVLSSGADWLGAFAIYVADIGVEFRVIEPPELRDRIRELAERLTSASAAS
jgi:predicted DNA-binding transcriptional regulator YafY